MENEDTAWSDWRDRFSDVYDASNYGSPLQSWVMRSSHSLVEKRFSPCTHFSRVLEIGAGTGMHLDFVRHSFDQYTLSDTDEKMLEVAQRNLKTQHGDRVKYEIQSGEGLNYDDNSIDRLVAIHVLEHIYYPHLALKEWRRVVKVGGVISILIPTDPGFAWRMSRHFGPRRYSQNLGFEYDYIMAREHVNSCNNLVALLRYYFPQSKESWWPLLIPSTDLNLFFLCQITVNK